MNTRCPRCRALLRLKEDQIISPMIADMRAKLEKRTWFLRMSVALNITIIGGFTTAVAMKVLSS